MTTPRRFLWLVVALVGLTWLGGAFAADAQEKLDKLNEREKHLIEKLEEVQQRERYIQTQLEQLRRQKQSLLEKQAVRQLGQPAATPATPLVPAPLVPAPLAPAPLAPTP
jgi:hypothetical protein